jgi:hypothetical protein
MVRRIEDIQKLIDENSLLEAYQAIEDLLSLGPKNTNVMKLKAGLLHSEGKFREESQLWRTIIGLDQEDEDAKDYFQRSMLEQREHEYFSDLLPTGGIRFLTNPRSVVTTSFIGIMGCALFLTLANFSHRFPILATPLLTYLSFGFFVGLPWALILYVYFRSLKDITIDAESIHLRTRTSDLALHWSELAKFYIARHHTRKGDHLYVLLVPKISEQAPILIPIEGSHSVVRAPSFFVREITKVFEEPTYETLDRVPLRLKPTLFS